MRIYRKCAENTKIYFVLSISNDVILKKNIKIFCVCKKTYIKSENRERKELL